MVTSCRKPQHATTSTRECYRPLLSHRWRKKECIGVRATFVHEPYSMAMAPLFHSKLYTRSSSAHCRACPFTSAPVPALPLIGSSAKRGRIKAPYTARRVLSEERKQKGRKSREKVDRREKKHERRKGTNAGGSHFEHVYTQPVLLWCCLHFETQKEVESPFGYQFRDKSTKQKEKTKQMGMT